jgi:hypothetical protein
VTEPVGEIAVPCLIVEFDGLPKVLMSAGAKTALVSGACCPLAQASALPKLVCKRSRSMPGAAPGGRPGVAVTLSANSIALPRLAAASLKAERRNFGGVDRPHHDRNLTKLPPGKVLAVQRNAWQS